MENGLISPIEIQNRTESGSLETLARRLREPSAQRSPKELAGAAAQMESLFIHHLFQVMRKTVPDDNGLLGKSNAEKMYTDMLDEELSKRIAEAGGLGLGKLIVEQLGPEASKDPLAGGASGVKTQTNGPEGVSSNSRPNTGKTR